MKEDAPLPQEKRPGFFKRLCRVFLQEPTNQEQLVEVLYDAEQRNVLDAESLDMIEGVLDVSEIKVDDVMIPRSQMMVVQENASIKSILPVILESAHSRYPVMDQDFEKVVGILIVKDLLQYGFSDQPKELYVKNVMRPAMMVPESQRLDSLLRDFRAGRAHMGIVLDEYGNVSGLVTIEDILEQIVGEIEDEHDIQEDQPDIVKQAPHQYLVQAAITIEDFNAYFHSTLEHPGFNTIGGLVMNRFGHVPKKGETIMIHGFQFTVHQADARRVISVRVKALE